MNYIVDLSKNSWNDVYVGNTLHNNQLILKLAQNGYPHKAMKLLVKMLGNYSVRIDTLCQEFADTGLGTISCSGWSYIYHPDAVSQSDAVKIAKANLLYVTNPVKFFKVYANINIQNSLHWLEDYYGDVDSFGKITIDHTKLISKLLRKAHICYDDDYGVGRYIYVIKQGSKRVVPDNANDGTGDTGAWIIGKSPEIRDITKNDINTLAKMLKATHMPVTKLEHNNGGTVKVN